MKYRLFLLSACMISCQGKSEFQLQHERDTAEFVRVVKECMDTAAIHATHDRTMPFAEICDKHSLELKYKIDHAPYVLNRGTAEIKIEIDAIIEDLHQMAVFARQRFQEDTSTPRYRAAVEGALKVADSIHSHLESLQKQLATYKSD